MNVKSYVVVAVLMLPLVFTNSVFAATPYQTEVLGSYGLFSEKSKANGFKNDFDRIGVDATYYLRPVDYETGPLIERAFLDKAANITASYDQRDPDVGEKSDTLGLEGRFVTDTDLIIDFGYSKADNGVTTDNTTTVGFGKYLDGQTTAVLTYEKEDNATISGTYRKLTNNESTGTAFSYELSLKYLDTDPDSGYGLDGIGTYYFSDEMSLAANLDYVKIKSFDTTTLALLGSYFYAENLFANLAYVQASDDDSKTSGVSFSVGGRF